MARAVGPSMCTPWLVVYSLGSLPVLPVFQNKKGRIELPGEKTLAALENYLLENIEEDTCVGIIIALYTGIRIGDAYGKIRLKLEQIQ